MARITNFESDHLIEYCREFHSVTSKDSSLLVQTKDKSITCRSCAENLGVCQVRPSLVYDSIREMKHNHLILDHEITRELKQEVETITINHGKSSYQLTCKDERPFGRYPVRGFSYDNDKRMNLEEAEKLNVCQMSYNDLYDRMRLIRYDY